jgi:hypothetical protein
MPPFTHQDVINLTVLSPSREVQVYLRRLQCENIVLLTMTFFDVVNLILKSNNNNNFMATLIPDCWFEKYLLSLILHWNIITKFLGGTKGTHPTHSLVPRKNCPSYHHFYHQLVHCIFRTIISRQRLLSVIYDILSLINSTF